MNPKFFIKCESPAFPKDSGLLGFEGVESISGLYEFEIDMILPPNADGLDLNSLVGQPASIGIRRDAYHEPLFIHGIFSEFEVVSQAGTPRSDWMICRAVLVPSLWRLTLNSRSYVWVDVSIPTVIREVIEAAGVNSDYSIQRYSGSYHALPFVCQYREQFLDFISRWMQQLGIFYFFDHSGDRERMIVTDRDGARTESKYEPVIYAPARKTGLMEGAEHFERFAFRRAAVPSVVKVRGYNYMAPAVRVHGACQTKDKFGGTVSMFEESVTSDDTADHVATVAAEALQCSRLMFHAIGNVAWIRAGNRFRVQEHFDPRVGKLVFMATEIRHSANQWRLWQDAPPREDGPEYVSEITAVPTDVQYRSPRATPVPRIYGTVTGVIDGLGTPYAEIDAQGRYKVKFKFDDGDGSGPTASCPVRMLQPHAGKQEGFHFPLRVGTEVAVAFQGGDPDQPVIVGAAPNATHPSPVTANNFTQNVIQSGSLNRIEIEDYAGAERITLGSPAKHSTVHLGATHEALDHNIVIKTDGTGLVNTGDNMDVKVGGNRTETIKGTLTEAVDGNVSETYKGTLTSKVTGDVTETYDAKHSVTVTADVKLDYKAKKTITVGAGVSETYQATQVTHVTGAVTQTYDAALKTTVGGARTAAITADDKLTVSGGQNVTVTGSAAHNYMADLTQAVMGPMTVSAVGAIGITSTGGPVNVTSPAAINLTAPNMVETVPNHIETTAAAIENYGALMENIGALNSVIGVENAVRGVAMGITALAFEVVKVAVKNTTFTICDEPIKIGKGFLIRL